MTDAPNVAKALGHSSRLRILELLLTGPASASTLAKQLRGISMGDASYHLGKLTEAGAVTLVETRPVRGATEQI